MAGHDSVCKERTTGRRAADPDGKGDTAGLADRIAEWIAGEVREAGRKGVVVGLSGGIDSGVTAALSRRALGDRVLGLIMPCESARQDEEDATLVAIELGIATVTVRLDEAFRALREVLPPGDALTVANLKPRLRMATLYYHANMLSYLVAGTGNRTELMVGYYTKYGDGGADILPIGGIYKTHVRTLAQELGLPKRIIGKPPSAGLWEGQTDEGELGITYPELDRALQALDTGRIESVPADRMAWVRDMVARSAHKRAGPSVLEAAE